MDIKWLNEANLLQCCHYKKGLKNLVKDWQQYWKLEDELIENSNDEEKMKEVISKYSPDVIEIWNNLGPARMGL